MSLNYVLCPGIELTRLVSRNVIIQVTGWLLKNVISNFYLFTRFAKMGMEGFSNASKPRLSEKQLTLVEEVYNTRDCYFLIFQKTRNSVARSGFQGIWTINAPLTILLASLLRSAYRSSPKILGPLLSNSNLHSSPKFDCLPSHICRISRSLNSQPMYLLE